MPHFEDELYTGPVVPGGPPPFGANTQGSSPMSKGIGPLGKVYIWDLGTPAALDTQAICNAQAIAGAGNAVINGTLAATNTNTGVKEGVLVEARCLSVVSSSAGDTTQTVTITGVDIYGQTMSQLLTLNGSTPVNSLKAFKKVTQVAVSAALAGNLSVGNIDTFGIPVCLTDKVYIIDVGYNNTLALDTGTPVVADVTSPATNATGDVRGTYALSSVSNGSKRLVMAIAMKGTQVGAQATRAAALGVNQV